MYSHDCEIRVRYGETDQMGIVYYGNYALYYEIARVEWLRSLGVTYKDMEEKMNIMLPVTYLQMRFVRPIFYDELITINSQVLKMPDYFIHFDMEIFGKDNKLRNKAQVSLCFMDRNTKIKTKIPPFLKKKLLPYYRNE